MISPKTLPIDNFPWFKQGIIVVIQKLGQFYSGNTSFSVDLRILDSHGAMFRVLLTRYEALVNHDVIGYMSELSCRENAHNCNMSAKLCTWVVW
jgi:hypothetical protein